MKVLVTSRSGAGKSTLSKELQSRNIAAFDADTVPDLAYWYSHATGQNLGKNFPPDYDPDAYDWRWDESILLSTLKSSNDVILCGSADNAADFYPLFDRLYILNLKPSEQRQRMTLRGDDGYGGDNELIQQRVITEQAQLVASASRIGAMVLDANLPINVVANNLLTNLYEK